MAALECRLRVLVALATAMATTKLAQRSAMGRDGGGCYREPRDLAGVAERAPALRARSAAWHDSLLPGDFRRSSSPGSRSRSGKDRPGQTKQTIGEDALRLVMFWRHGAPGCGRIALWLTRRASWLARRASEMNKRRNQPLGAMPAL